MTTTTLHLMHALKWQGGTVHQVASATGLKVETILTLGDHKVEEIDHFDSFADGYSWACSGGGERNIPPEVRGDMYFWLGVVAWQEDKK